MAEERWSGFEPTGYEINWKVLTKAPLIEVSTGKDRTQTDAGAILREVLPHLFTPLSEDGSMGVTPARQDCTFHENTGALTITTPNRTITLDTLGNKTSFAADVVTTLITVDQTDAARQSFHPVFFYYDRDRVVDDVHESFSFFVVNGDRIVVDRVTFNQHSGSGFDPNMFAPAFKVTDRIWADEQYVMDARVRWWYRRFYEETDAGKLTVLREDVDLYHYVPEWKHREAIAAHTAATARATAQIRRLLGWALIVLLLIAILLWR